MGTVMVIPAKRQVGNTVKQSDQKKLRVAAYCRVSTDSEEQETSYEAQVTHYTEYIQKNPEWELAGIFADDGISGTNTKKRDEFNRMIDECMAGNIDMIITNIKLPYLIQSNFSISNGCIFKAIVGKVQQPLSSKYPAKNQK